MADQLVRVKVEDKVSSNGVPGVLMRIFDENDVLQAQGITSSGPSPALGVFETILDGSAEPGTLYTIHGQRRVANISTRSQIRVTD